MMTRLGIPIDTYLVRSYRPPLAKLKYLLSATILCPQKLLPEVSVGLQRLFSTKYWHLIRDCVATYLVLGEYLQRLDIRT